MRWELLQLQHGGQGGPGKRWGHSCNSVKGGRFLYVFGGYGKDNCQTNQVHVFDTVMQTWSRPEIKGAPPTPRDSHSCTTVGDNLYVFGGTDGMRPLRDLHILDTSSHSWITPSVRGEGPAAREGHSAALVGKRLFIFGGSGKSSDNNEEVYYNDLYILNTETFVWKLATTSGILPSARDSHTCSSWRNKIIIVGGEDGHDYYLSDVHVLDAETLVWKELTTSGIKLPPRAGHSTVAFGKNLFVFGGFTDAQNLYDDLFMLDVDTGTWTKVLTVGDGPSARFSMAGDCLDPLKGGVLVFVGGCNKSLEALDDMYYLHTGLTGFHDEKPPEKLSLRKQLKLKCQEQNLNPPLHDKALVKIDTNVDFGRTMPAYLQPGRENFGMNQEQSHLGKKTFNAKITESFPHGYTIETSIDGMPLRGVLFANKPVSPQISNQNGNRKRTVEEIGACVTLNGDHNNKLKSSRALKEDAPDKIHSKESTSHGWTKEAAVSPESIGASNLPQASQVMIPEPSVAPLNLNDEMMTDAKNDVELPKENPTIAKDTVTLSLNQDCGAAAEVSKDQQESV